MNTEPIVSVIIPAHNCERFIEETVHSVLNQTYSHFEILIVDDGSTDNQKEKMEQLSAKDQRIKCIYQTNQGVSAARNNGYHHSKGKYVAFLDADDVWLSNNLEEKVKKIESGDYGLVHSDGYIMNHESVSTGATLIGSEGALLDDMLSCTGTQVPGPSSILLKQTVLEKVGLFDTNLSTSADKDFFIRVAASFTIGRVAKPTWKYRIHEANMHKNIALMEKDIVYVYKKASMNGLFKNWWFERKCYATMYLILAASWIGDGKNKLKGIKFTFLALMHNPFAISDVIDRIVKRWKS